MKFATAFVALVALVAAAAPAQANGEQAWRAVTDSRGRTASWPALRGLIPLVSG